MQDLSYPTLFALFSALLALAAFSEHRGWGSGRAIAISALRAGLQLSLVGFVLEWLFQPGREWASFPYVLWMLGAATSVLWGRFMHKRPPGLKLLDFYWVLSALGLSTLALSLAVGRVEQGNWNITPAVLIPFLGIVLGNVLTSLGLAIERFQSDIRANRTLIEARLLQGQAVNEAVGDFRRAALSAGMTPILNALTAAGIVSLPGALTGQLLAGQDPAAAVRVQLLMLFALTGISWAGCAGFLVVLLRKWRVLEREALSAEVYR
jgi:putative ABC transport system permease protein